ncbi:hypothetical protein [Streptomyces lavendulocolor]|uniref:hypothetical protein n=1 Tax=Streptomyces lavendulocolor TaxID=67316 RepID=UPI003C2C2C93
MATSKARITALITPVGQDAQDEARALAEEGRTSKAVARLRKDSGLGLHPASAALDLLGEGRPLPTSYEQALGTLRDECPELVGELTVLLHRDDRNAAIRLLRERTDMDLAGGYHLVEALAAHLGAA